MKKNKYLLAVATLFVLGACNSLTPEEVDFMATVEKTTVAVGEPVVFTFDGNPNFITLYSGESGHVYAYRNRVKADLEDIVVANLSFGSKMQYGTQLNVLRVYLSKNFPGLSKKDQEADKKLIQTHSWTEITNQCIIPYNETVGKTNLDLSGYIDGFTLALQYTANAQSKQRTLTITDLLVKNELADGQVTSLPSGDLGFTAFDMAPSNAENDPYKVLVSGTAHIGTWNLINISKNQLLFAGGDPPAAGVENPLWKDNDDWLISKKVELTNCIPDQGVVIKDISRRVSGYEYVYTKPGTYTVTFLAGNTNVEGVKSVVKEFTIEVQ